MNHLLEIIRQQLSSPFVSGGLVITFTAAIVAFARNLPSKLWGHLRDQFMVEVDVQQTDPLFDWLTLWLNDHPYSQRARRLRASTILSYEAQSNQACSTPEPCGASSADEEIKRPSVILSPAKGQHFLFYRGTLLWLDRGKGEAGPPDAQNAKMSFFQPESYHLRIFGRSQTKLRALLDEAVDRAMKMQEKRVSAFVAHCGSWRRLRTFQPRKIETVVLPEGVAENILSTLREFLSHRDWYRDMGIPYHFGMLFHGIPGTGKTSIIGALAGELKINLYILSLAGKEMSDENFACLLSEVPPGSFMVMEDVDAALATRARTEDTEQKRGLTLTGILNALDGFMATEGSIVLMTTNHKSRLDPALIRPGRVDFEQEFGVATMDQLRRLYLRFFPDATPIRGDADIWAMTMGGRTMAEAQQDLLKLKKEQPHDRGARAAVAHARECSSAVQPIV